MGLLDSPVEPIAVLGGDFTYAAYQPASRTLVLASAGGPRIEQPLRDLVASIEITTEEKAGIGPGLGWGVAGALVAGPVGALAGALLGSNAKKIVFIARLKDGRKFMGRTSPRVYTQLQAALL